MARKLRAGLEGGFYHLIASELRGERHLSLNGLSIAALSRRHDAALSRLKHTPDLERQISKVIKWVR